MEQLKQQLQAAGILYKENEPLSAHCTFRIGGPADLFVMPRDEDQLCQTVQFCKQAEIRYYLLGNGSNILFADEGFRGAVIDVSAEAAGMGLSIYQNADGDYISAPAGLKLSELCKFALQHDYTGLEFAYGIPGTVGGAVYMNAGAYGGEMPSAISPPTAAGWTVKRPSWTFPTGTARLKRMMPASLAQCSTWKKATRMPSRPG